MEFQNYFLRLWKSEYPEVVIPAENRFAKCDDCVKFKMLKSSKSIMEFQVDILRDWHSQHIDLANDQREYYSKHISKAQLFPDKYMVLSVDGMGSSMQQLPVY